MPNIGDRVLAKWPQEEQWWYPGVVTKSDASGIEVTFDDGDRSVVAPDQMRPLSVGVGSRVYCRWRGGAAYYPGKVGQAQGAAIAVDYDDGDQETTSISLIRVNRNDL